ncbi:hypothetical protein WOSG25_030610 [Weissella oryzae SG25]|uniref:Uncharacterized protein n=1 Tax=Weissella oryzae (strain DSM 25784 / JCM 18191 / LMG 30913 / SG25) TaxID=1329250 RepID=A0A069CSK6_WEIOS|nr:hypothetical protein WOSG25_030610 [Weissella oryzae SG25]
MITIQYLTIFMMFSLKSLSRLVTDEAFQGFVVGVVTIIASAAATIGSNAKIHKKANLKLSREFRELKLREIRTELNLAIDHDYGSKIVAKIYAEYKLLGGNSYMTEKVKQYIENETVRGGLDED